MTHKPYQNEERKVKQLAKVHNCHEIIEKGGQLGEKDNITSAARMDTSQKCAQAFHDGDSTLVCTVIEL
jgi:hypothetical protein